MSRIIRGGAFALPFLKIEYGTKIDRYLKGYNPSWYLVYDKRFRVWHIAHITERSYTPFMRFDTNDRPGDIYIMAQIQKSWHDSHLIKERGISRLIDEGEYERQRRLEKEDAEYKDYLKDVLRERRIYV